YSNREIFLRELISNASDAIDKARLEALGNEALLKEGSDYRIRLIPDRSSRTLTISDNGVGMTLEEAERNLGTIAHSGTRAFLEALKEKGGTDNPEMIGQFGVGFYASFMVADQVTVVSRRGGASTACRWHSLGDGTYTLEESERSERGTDITLHLKEGMDEFLQEWQLKSIVKKYSDFVQYPIILETVREEPAKGVDGTVIEGGGTITRPHQETINSMKAIWTKPKAEVSDEEYREFYHHVSHDTDAPLQTIHYAVEGMVEFKALLFIPRKRPLDIFWHDQRRGVQLYVRKVFITDRCEALLPDYLRFVRGVVESSDLPLNVSRELLQEDAQLKRIEKNLVGKVLATLAEMKEKSPDDYRTFFREFGVILKEGVHSDGANREKLADLLLIESSSVEAGSSTTLKEYRQRMPETQEEIFYLSGHGRDILAASPHLERMRSRGLEVLFFTDPIDEWVVQGLTSYDGKKLRAIDSGELTLGSEEERKQETEKYEEQQQGYQTLLKTMSEHLKEKVSEVRLSHRLTDSASCLVSDPHALSPSLERMLKAMQREVPEQKRTLEVNPDHPLLQALQRLQEKSPTDRRLSDFSDLLFDQALLAEGSPIPDPTRFNRLTIELMTAAAER
ncbi:MAG TPA: molecular chaperone HtpG, partial [Geobacterales bacterium]|nr:molecular chaperone HtpG [Geobacterales bacterium]